MKQIDHNAFAIECLYHSIELYLTITAHDGSTKVPDKLVKDSAFNLISEIKERDMGPISNCPVLNSVHWHKM